MRIRRVYIKRAGGEIASEACYTAWRGFSALGYPLDFFEWDDLTSKCLRLDRDTLVVGGTVAAHAALRQIGVEVPLPLNIPQQLLPFAGRRIWESTLGVVRQAFEANECLSLFVKPLVETKSFTGSVVSTEADLAKLQHLSGDIRLQVADIVQFSSEWRYYVHRGSVVGIAHYAGDWSVTPDSSQILQSLIAYSDSPVAYSLDFGVTVAGQSIIVEANDAFALGAHGIDAFAYARMLEDRWLQITGGQNASA